MLTEDELVKLKKAVSDAAWLLENGYGRETVVKLVGDRYGLSRSVRSVIYRCVYPSSVATSIKSKLINEERARHYKMAIDGTNVLGTLIALLSGDPVFLSLDGLLRDVSEMHKSLLKHARASEAAELLVKALRGLSPPHATVLLESQVSGSGSMASKLRVMFSDAGLKGSIYTTRRVDSDLLKLDAVITSSDSVIASRCNKLFDIPKYCLRLVDRNQVKLVDLERLHYSDWWSYGHVP